MGQNELESGAPTTGWWITFWPIWLIDSTPTGIHKMGRRKGSISFALISISISLLVCPSLGKQWRRLLNFHYSLSLDFALTSSALTWTAAGIMICQSRLAGCTNIHLQTAAWSSNSNTTCIHIKYPERWYQHCCYELQHNNCILHRTRFGWNSQSRIYLLHKVKRDAECCGKRDRTLGADRMYNRTSQNLNWRKIRFLAKIKLT